MPSLVKAPRESPSGVQHSTTVTFPRPSVVVPKLPRIDELYNVDIDNEGTPVEQYVALVPCVVGPAITFHPANPGN